MGWVVINGDTLQIVGKYREYGDIVVIEGSELKTRHEPAIVCHTESGADWSQLSQLEAGLLCKNLGIPFVLGNYAQTLANLREYTDNLDFAVVTAQQLELFNQKDEVLRNKYPDSNIDSKRVKSAPTPSQPKAPTQSRPPSSKGATGRVWTIADEEVRLIKEQGDTPDIKSLRKRVIEICVENGIHEATAATQWSKWKKDKGL